MQEAAPCSFQCQHGFFRKVINMKNPKKNQNVGQKIEIGVASDTLLEFIQDRDNQGRPTKAARIALEELSRRGQLSDYENLQDS